MHSKHLAGVRLLFLRTWQLHSSVFTLVLSISKFPYLSVATMQARTFSLKGALCKINLHFPFRVCFIEITCRFQREHYSV